MRLPYIIVLEMSYKLNYGLYVAHVVLCDELM